MTGKTKRFVEDTIISFVIIIIIAILYYVASPFIFENNTAIIEEKTVDVVEDKVKKKLVPPFVQLDDVNQTKKSTKIIDETTIQENPEEKIDKQKLKQFILNIKSQIAKNIKYDLEKSVIKEDNYIKIRITILNTGDYEQLTFVGGNIKLFEKNKENILKIFPLIINEDIREAFPRYLRIELRK